MHQINVTVAEILPNDYVLFGGVLYRAISTGPHRVFENSTKILFLDDEIVAANANDVIEIIFKDTVRLDILRPKEQEAKYGF